MENQYQNITSLIIERLRKLLEKKRMKIEVHTTDPYDIMYKLVNIDYNYNRKNIRIDTTLLMQVLNDLLEEGIDPTDIDIYHNILMIVKSIVDSINAPRYNDDYEPPRLMPPLLKAKETIAFEDAYSKLSGNHQKRLDYFASQK